MPHLQQGAKMLGKRALQMGVQVAQDVLAGENVKTAKKNSSQSGGGRKTPRTQNSLPPGKRVKASSQ